MSRPVIRDELENIADWDRYYEHTFYCVNCGNHNDRYIRKGVLVKGLFIKCEKCGCEVKEKP